MNDRPALVLASASPRRRQLLAGLGLDFQVRPVEVDETPLVDEDPEACVLRLARLKAETAAAPGELVLAADTIVLLDGQILGKPRDPAEAARMLTAIAGREHIVLTGLAVLSHLSAERPREAGALPSLATAVERSRVRMAPMSAEEITWYVGTGEPLDKAGAYAVQGLGALFVEEVFGNYTNVVGLPLPATYRLFASLGFDLREFSRRT